MKEIADRAGVGVGASSARHIRFSNRHDSTEHDVCRHCGFLVLENPDDGPPLVAKYSVGISVARLIRFKLGDPPLTVLSGRCAVFRARMPKAAVHEDGEPLSRKNNIDAATVPYDSAINKETEAESMKSGPKRKLRMCITSPRGRHSLADDLARGCRGRPSAHR